MTISIVVPNYNHAASLPAALSALAAQTLRPDEIIIVDDGSTDSSIDVIEGLAASDETIKVLRHDRNRGAVAAMNTGIAAATGSHVALIAADDVTRITLLERLTEALALAPGASFASAEVALADRNGTVHGVRPPTRPANHTRFIDPSEMRRLLQRTDNFILTGAALFVRQRLVDAGSLREELGSFADGFLVRKLALEHGFVFVPEVLAEWRVDPEGFSRSATSDPDRADRMLEVARKALVSDPVFPQGYAERFADRWRFGVLRLALVPDMNKRILRHYAPAPKSAAPVFMALSGAGSAGRLLALGWATLAYRPISVWELLKTRFGRENGAA